MLLHCGSLRDAGGERYGWKACNGWILQSLVDQRKEGSYAHVLSGRVTQTDLLFVRRSLL